MRFLMLVNLFMLRAKRGFAQSCADPESMVCLRNLEIGLYIF